MNQTEQEIARAEAIVDEVLGVPERRDLLAWDSVRNQLRDRITTALAAASQNSQLQSDVNKFWLALERSWDIEPREFFEKEARENGFDSPLAMAVHYMWKREGK